MLDLINIHKTFNPGTINEKVALDGVNLHLDDGDFCTIIGGNGAGKSTTLNAVAGVWPVDEGTILIDGENVTGVPEHKRAAYLGRVFQDPMTGTAAILGIDENLALAARRGSRRGLKWGVTKAEREHYRELLKELDLGLEDRLTAKVGLLSGGQRQALQEQKLTAMMVTHNMKDAIAHGNRLIMMHEGKVILDISGEDKQKLTVPDLMHQFEVVSGEEFASDKAILA